MTQDKFTTGQQRMAGAQASSADPMNASAPEESGHHGRAALATSSPGITRFRECGVCRLRKLCSVDLKGRWLCIECRGCLDV